MKARCTLAIVTIASLVAAPAWASVISASGQTVRSKAADKIDYLDVSTIQTQLNGSLEDAIDLTSVNGLNSGRSAAGSGSGGFLVGNETSSARFRGFGGAGAEDALFDPDGDKEPDAISRDAGGEGNILGIGSGARTGGKGGHRGGGKGRGGIHAAPEPSTWLLLGTGLALVGGYAAIRRRGFPMIG